jgi:hypothetical protein
MSRGYRSRLERHLLAAGPGRDRDVRELRVLAGRSPWRRWVRGESVPAPWLRQRLAEALRVQVGELFPTEPKQPDERPRPPRRRVG